MQTLNFFPYYEPLLSNHSKTTTFRLNKPHIQPGERVRLTVGWDATNRRQLHLAQVERVYSKSLFELAADDFDGESPDCRTTEAARLVLSAIYRKTVQPQDEVWVVKFRHLREQE
jgi:hypothetical protein